MKTQNDWQGILLECKNKVLTSIKPCLKTIREPQPNLGIGAGGDAMKPVDLAAEKAITDILQKHDVSFTLISEESGVERFGAGAEECFVAVDPIDGTSNLMHGLPFYACSIAISDRKALEAVYAGLVTDLYHDVTYTAIKGEGAFRDGKKILHLKNRFFRRRHDWVGHKHLYEKRCRDQTHTSNKKF